ncbi:MAG TPA: dipeptide/oligopeptide/nickel ABC transporter permease/ATP-binding protein [Gaiellaceae bacterium]|nr:dipeptide/oligopeptide/nickel ABC transporter permease/ATP-binding protein [Gaiellaceae bacterium]
MNQRGLSRILQALRTPVGIVASAGLLLVIVLAIAAPFIWSGDASRIDILHTSQGASHAHWLGTDALGRDIFYRVLVATRLSVFLAVLAAAIGAAVGIPIGAVPAIVGGPVGRLVTGFINLAVAFPALLVAIFVASIIGVGAHGAVIGIAVAIAPYYARLSQTLSSSVAGSEYLAAARMLGVKRVRLLTRHVLPNIAEPLLITSTISIGDALLSLAGLSFLGLGVQPPQYDWGRMLNEGLNRIYVNPEVALGPAVAITLGALTFALFGEVLAKAAGAGGARRWLRGELAEADAASVRAGVGSTEPAGRAGAGLAGAGATDLVLAVENLTVSFPGGAVPVRDVSLRIEPGEIVGIVGESGSGKTLTAMAIADLLPAAAHLSASRLCLFGEDPRALSTSQRRRLLGRSLAVVYQDPMSALNPALRVGRQVGEVAEVHQGSSKREALGSAVDRLRAVHIGSPESRARQYPHEFSGGMRQRAVIAMGLMAEPKLIVADEPTTALDVTVQQQILRLLRDVSVSRSAAAILISHDVAVVSQLCSRVVVMYAGRVVEELDVGTLVDGPAHPYTAALVAAVPTMASDRERPLASIPGRAPTPFDDLPGCPFAPRCPRASDLCRAQMPPLEQRSPTHRAACWHPMPAGADIVEEVAV